MNTENLRRLDELLLSKCHERLTDAETSELRSMLRDDPEAMDRYLDLCEIDVGLSRTGTLARPLPFGQECPSSDHHSSLTSRPHTGADSTKRSLDFVIAAASVVLIVAGLGSVGWIETAMRPEVRVAMGGTVGLVASSTEEDEGLVASSTEEDDGLVASSTTVNRNHVPRRNEWKTIQSTGSLKHPPLKETAIPVSMHSDKRPIKFNRDIRPILSGTCFHCHGPDEEGRRADLRLDTPEGATEDLGGYQPIVAGDVDESEAWQRIISDDPDLLMPPPESHLVLTEEQKQLIRRWIAEGAEYEGHWAFAAPVRPTVPEVPIANATGQRWGKNAIDAFVANRMVEAGLEPSAEADPRMLIRRLSLDLIGLPPTVAEVRDFVADYDARGEEAWQDAITRLLDSHHFGERMAIPWLDQARYADTNGYSIDGGRDMWLWRDWVINAYNQNMPFDQFVVDQIAGDLLPEATDAQRIATGFNRNHMVTHEGGTIPAENLTNYVADRVKTTGEVFLGLTMGCAQCHDHKYDPISQKEYYQFFAFFNGLSDKGLDGNAGINPAPRMQATTVLPKTELPQLRQELTQLQKQLTRATADFDQWLAETRAAEQSRGDRFQTHHLEALDVSSPNRPGEYVVQSDGSVLLEKPSGGLNAMSHVLKLPADLGPDQTIDGIRVRFFPFGKDAQKQLTPHSFKVPRVTTVLVSAGEQPAKQVDIYRQVAFAQATASSSAVDASAGNVLDERNLQWWMPSESDSEQHLTLTFDQPIRPDQTPYLSVMVFFGAPNSLPHHWKIEGFSGKDTDSVYDLRTSRTILQDPTNWTDEQRRLVESVYRRHAPSLQRLRTRIANLTERIDVLTKPHWTMVMDTAKKPRETFVLARGQYDAIGEKVTPSTLKVLPKIQSELTEPTQWTRLDLAKWMVRTDHPLTARVAVNRIWGLLFGTGIVATSADFGSQGQWPSHPELLDYLATEFVAGGWDQKELIRRIVSSATYRQDSFASEQSRSIDPNNRLLSRGANFRLSAELIRDQALAFSGLLVRRIGGPSVHPYQPAGLWKEVSHFGSTPATKQVFVQDHGEKLYRRSLYTITKRTSPHPSMSAFDAPNREMCTVQRGVTNTPMQALVTLNDTQFVEAARVFAANILNDESLTDDAHRIAFAVEQVTCRQPTPEEARVLMGLLNDERGRYRESPDEAVATVSVGEWPLAENLDPVEHAAWTQIATLLFNLSEALSHL